MTTSLRGWILFGSACLLAVAIAGCGGSSGRTSSRPFVPPDPAAKLKSAKSYVYIDDDQLSNCLQGLDATSSDGSTADYDQGDASDALEKGLEQQVLEEGGTVEVWQWDVEETSGGEFAGADGSGEWNALELFDFRSQADLEAGRKLIFDAPAEGVKQIGNTLAVIGAGDDSAIERCLNGATI
jgi:hypothetical protein